MRHWSPLTGLGYPSLIITSTLSQVLACFEMCIINISKYRTFKQITYLSFCILHLALSRTLICKSLYGLNSANKSHEKGEDKILSEEREKKVVEYYYDVVLWIFLTSKLEKEKTCFIMNNIRTKRKQNGS